MLGAVRAGEQPSVRDGPAVEQRDGRLREATADVLIPQIGARWQGAEEGEDSPAGQEVGADELPVVLGGQGSVWIGELAGARVVPIAERDCTPVNVSKADRMIDKMLSMSSPCATLGGRTSVAEGEQPVRRHNPISLAVAHPAKGTQRPRLQRRP